MTEHTHRFKEFNLTQLRIFCEFLQKKSFADTARAMNLSHSGVWQQVRALERRFGVSLLQRHGRTWRPTEDGQALFDQCLAQLILQKTRRRRSVGTL